MVAGCTPGSGGAGSGHEIGKDSRPINLNFIYYFANSFRVNQFLLPGDEKFI
jgi:hypothetical protein